MRRRRALQVLAALALAGAQARALDLPVPPTGFAWVELTEIKGAFLLPEGWHFRQEKKGGTLGYFLTREPIEGEGLFETGLSINVIRNVSAKTGRRAHVYAADFAAASPPGEELLDSWQRVMGSMHLFGARVRSSREGQEPVIVHRLVIGNAVTDTLYLILFESPESSWEEMWKLGDVMLQKFLLDDEI